MYALLHDIGNLRLRLHGCVLLYVRIQGDSVLPCSHEPVYVCIRIFVCKFLHFESARARVTMTMRTWPHEGESIRIYPFTRLYENSVSVGIHFGRRFQISSFWIFV